MLNTIDEEDMETEDQSLAEQTALKNDEPSTSKMSGLVSHILPLSGLFYEDKETEVQLSDFFELPQILNTDEKLSHFTGINFDILRTVVQCVKRTAEFNHYD